MFLEDPWARLGPNIIGATGGSGTRVVARIARHGGLFIGAELNHMEDAAAFGAYSDRWINAYVAHTTFPRRVITRIRMVRDLKRLVTMHLLPLEGIAQAWGWKEPRSIYLLPFWNSQFSGFRFLHLVRDGRDMAYSSNQNQLQMHGNVLLNATENRWPEPLRSMALWSRINLRAAEFGERILGDRYLRVRFEDLCLESAATTSRILAFLGLEGDADSIAALEVASAPRETLGRWKHHATASDATELTGIGRVALLKFGYEV